MEMQNTFELVGPVQLPTRKIFRPSLLLVIGMMQTYYNIMKLLSR